jgi:hypothetical protein
MINYHQFEGSAGETPGDVFDLLLMMKFLERRYFGAEILSLTVASAFRSLLLLHRGVSESCAVSFTSPMAVFLCQIRQFCRSKAQILKIDSGQNKTC